MDKLIKELSISALFRLQEHTQAETPAQPAQPAYPRLLFKLSSTTYTDNKSSQDISDSAQRVTNWAQQIHKTISKWKFCYR